MSTLLIANPNATTAHEWVPGVVADAFASLGEVHIETTTKRGHAADLAATARRDGVQTVIAFGGDGTLNEVVNGLLADDSATPVPVVATIPGGHTNVVARALGLPNDPIEATSILIESARHGRTQTCNIGRANDRYFVFSAGLGVDAQVIRRVEEQRAQGVKASIPLYVASALLQFVFTSPLGKAQLQIELPDGAVIDGVYTTIVQNLSPWTFIGTIPVTFAPEATPENGLSVYGIRSLDPVSLASYLGRAVLKPEWLDSGRAAHDLSGFTVRADRPLPLQVDGDLAGDFDEIRFDIRTKAVEFLVP